MTHKTPIATPLWLCDENGNPLDEGQKKLAVSVGQNLLIVAGPGSGKTRVLVSHYLHLLMERRDWDVHNIAAITFTEKAAAEMKTRVQKILLNVVQKSHDQQDRERARYLLDSLGHAQVQTIHSFCADLLRQHALQLGLDPSFTGLDETAANLLKSEVTDSFLIKVLDDSFDPLHDAVRFIVENWSYEKTSRILQHLLKIRAYLHSVGSDGDLRIIVDELDRPGVRDYWKQCYTAVERHYDQEKWRRNCLDFDDLLIKTWNLLQDDGVRDRIRSQYRYILVDELQDVDALQMEIIKSLCGWDEGRVSFFGVGDPMQSIYRFRGAMVEKLRSLEEEFRQRRWACQMKRNYRSSDKIVRFLNYLFSRLFQERAEVVGQTAVRSDRLSPPVTITVYRGTKSRTEVLRREAWAIAQTIRKIVSGNSSEDRRTHFRDIAVLLRDTRHINVLTDVFREAAIPYHVLSGYGFFETQEIKDLITFLEAISEPDNDLAAAAFLRSPFVGISDPTLLLLRQKGLLNWQAVVGTEEWKSEQLSEISSAEAKRLNWGKYLLREGAKRLDQGAVRVLEWLLEETEYEAILTALPHGKQAL
ncbi:MAG: UvrD-helicase domain-containing protein, partial [Candidatus Caldarchaeum sp.]